jgi:hypothetical protein
VIHPDVLVEHIDITHARHFVDLSKIAQPNPTVLYVLHDRGKVLKAWNTLSGKVLMEGRVDMNEKSALELKQKHGVDEVQLIDRHTLDHYLREAQSLDKAGSMNGFDFRAWVRGLKKKVGRGFLVYPEQETFDLLLYMERTREFVKEKFLPDCVFILGVFDQEEWWTSLVAIFEAGEIRILSTFECLPEEALTAAALPLSHQNLLQMAAQTCQKPAFGLFLPREEFEKFARNQWRGMGDCQLQKTEPKAD